MLPSWKLVATKRVVGLCYLNLQLTSVRRTVINMIEKTGIMGLGGG